MKTLILDKDFNVVAEREHVHRSRVKVTSSHCSRPANKNVASKMFINSLTN